MLAVVQRFLSIVWVAAVLAVAATAGARDVPRVAVLDFEVTQVVSVPGAESLGSELADELEAELFRSRRFSVITRKYLAELFDEIAMSEEGLTDSERALTFGQVDVVDILLLGNLRLRSEREWRVSIRGIKVPSGELAFIKVADASGKDDLARVAATFATAMRDAFPVEGTVVLIESAGAFVDVGTDHGVLLDDTEGVLLQPRDAAGEPFPMRIGSFRVLQVAARRTLIEPTLLEGETLRVGDIARFDAPRTVAEETGASLPSVGGVAFEVLPTDAVVSIDGEVVGVGSVTVEDLAPGAYGYLVEAEGFEPIEGRLEVVAGDRSTVDVQLSRSSGRVVVDVDPPSARLMVDDRNVQSPFELTEGRHELIVRADGYAEERITLDVVAGETLPLRIELARREATIIIDVFPPDAVVRLDGVRRAAREFSVEPGSYAFEVVAAGFEPFAQQVVVAAGQMKRLEVRLEPEAAVLALDVDAPQFSVTVDDREVGFIRVLTLPPGTHHLRIEAPGRSPSELSVSLAPGESRELTIRLTQEHELALLTAAGTDVVARSASGESIALGTVTASPTRFTLPEGRYELRLHAPDDAPWRSMHPVEIITIELTGDPEAVLEVRASGYLSMDAQGTDTVIVLDDEGRQAYRGPPAPFLPLAPGAYVVRAADDDSVDAVRIELAPAATARVELSRAVAPPEAPDTAEDAAPAAPDTAEDAATAAPDTAAAPAVRTGVVRFSSNVAPARVLLSGRSDEEVRLGQDPVEVELPTGLYMLRAEAAGARPLDDVLAIDAGGVLGIDLRFTDERILAGIGAIGHAGGIDTLLVIRQQGFGQSSASIEIRGPSGWNQDRVWSRTLDFEQPYHVLEGVAPLPGDYRVETHLPGAVPIVNELTLPAVSPLDRTERLRVDAPSRDAVRATWSRVPDALSYEVLVGDPNDPVASTTVLATMVPSAQFDRIDQPTGRPVQVCLTSLTWDPALATLPPDGVIAASRLCDSFTPRAPAARERRVVEEQEEDYELPDPKEVDP